MTYRDKHFTNRRHVVDEDAKKVYLIVNNWSGAMYAPVWVEKYYPGYKAVFVTEQTLTEKENDRTNSKEE